MQVRGKHFSNWWLLLLFSFLAVSAPFLLILFFAMNNLAGAIFGPPVIWNRPRQPPPIEDLAGGYTESERHPSQSVPYSNAKLELRSDGTMTVSDLPWEVDGKACTLMGIGRWGRQSAEQRITLFFTPVQKSLAICQSGAYEGFELAGRSTPYSLYWILGDPDSGTGVWLKKD